MTRAVLVTGASSGIGEAASLELARRGFAVYAGVRSERDAERLRLQRNVTPLILDVTDADSIARATAAIKSDGVELAGLVNNAGIALAGPIEAVPLSAWRRQFDVNLFGAIAVTQACLPALRESGGRIVFVGSVSGRVAFPYIAPYSTSKFALRALADALRSEVRPAGIAVSLIEPGSVKTPIWSKGRAMRDEMFSWLAPHMPQYYRDALGTVIAGIEGEERGGMPVSLVTNAIVRAVTDRRPRAHDLIGTTARIGSILALLPAALHDRFLRVTMRLP
jgi:NAD(P)-dependent dehydrogenase (short-subunit alcohol dehydrogenase family)